MDILQCLITDDEPVARAILAEYIQEVDFLALSAEAEDPIQAEKVLEKIHIDLLFLDIEMPGMNGLHFLNNLSHPPLVIMTTAFTEYAVQGFELNVLDYLTKPIGFDRFLKAVTRAKEYHLLTSPPSPETQVCADGFFFVKCDQRLEKIILDEVVYVEGLTNYVIIHTRRKDYIVYLTLKSIEEQLPAGQFIRIHKSYLVALSSIQSIEGNLVRIEKGELPLSRLYKEEVMREIGPKIFKR